MRQTSRHTTLSRSHTLVARLSPNEFAAASITIKRGRFVHALAYTLMSFRFVAMEPTKMMSECCARRQHHRCAIVTQRKFGVSV